MIVCGVMSGTSLDGIDVIIVEIHGKNDKLHHKQVFTKTFDFTASLRLKLQKIVDGIPVTAQELAETEEMYESEVSNSILKAQKLSSSIIELVGSHGQTIYHRPRSDKRAFTWQIGSGRRIQAAIECPVVCDFRQADILAGGHGAPIMPGVETDIYDSTDNTAYLNIGGIANISIRSQNLGFDTGPGNCLIDLAMKTLLNKDFDEDGLVASSGICDENLINVILKMDFFHRAPPKSTGRELFSKSLLNKILENSATKSHQDIITSITEATIRSIVMAVNTSQEFIEKLVVSGGGARNSYIMKRLKAELKTIKVVRAENSDFTEALGMAIYAYRRKMTLPTRLTTGSDKEVILGELYE